MRPAENAEQNSEPWLSLKIWCRPLKWLMWYYALKLCFIRFLELLFLIFLFLLKKKKHCRLQPEERWLMRADKKKKKKFGGLESWVNELKVSNANGSILCLIQNVAFSFLTNTVVMFMHPCSVTYQTCPCPFCTRRCIGLQMRRGGRLN